MGSEDQRQNFVKGKGKRTKRQRSSSPFGLASTMTDSSSSGSGSAVRGGGGGGGERGVVMDDYNSISSPTTSGEIYESTEEEEDMANCLIMLAQGDRPKAQIQENNIGELKMEKLSNISGKFSGSVASTNTNNKAAGFYVYECKTCNRSFPSFQALGGHRASHKKPKAAVVEEKKPTVIPALPEYSEEAQQFNKSSPPLVANNIIKGNKIHECSICGSEFTSGQALGGHMRRHRVAAAAAAAAAAGNNQTAAINISRIDRSCNTIREVKPAAAAGRSILALDLNLPAPEDDHHLRDSKFQFGSTQQTLVFSAPALVDCHY
ncbi:Zinc finger protein [Melia azedarach]|uniref:Zinc finger protein n=1 Tax=Melia azedarach TaxID=155640 RepID=A0ACC1YMG4_MELAZ|nr:Zinc finger protein [Melia azedarach]